MFLSVRISGACLRDLLDPQSFAGLRGHDACRQHRAGRFLRRPDDRQRPVRSHLPAQHVTAAPLRTSGNLRWPAGPGHAGRFRRGRRGLRSHPRRSGRPCLLAGGGASAAAERHPAATGGAHGRHPAPVLPPLRQKRTKRLPAGRTSLRPQHARGGGRLRPVRPGPDSIRRREQNHLPGRRREHPDRRRRDTRGEADAAPGFAPGT